MRELIENFEESSASPHALFFGMWTGSRAILSAPASVRMRDEFDFIRVLFHDVVAGFFFSSLHELPLATARSTLLWHFIGRQA